jgi:hypothetical protein
MNLSKHFSWPMRFQNLLFSVTQIIAWFFSYFTESNFGVVFLVGKENLTLKFDFIGENLYGNLIE